ncbi:hypothetical protein UA08_07515 [Talaromyces atroroseus]|uniref:GST C-terminal domain-containing protein n=1 Tax=Talaromyces atroroseus TaxID=1441469 RepID=A0A225AS95_TALAT|nr:hypothetical protein UA08_07515 [Talaromyces atroroseus]OKL57295.1 hypothetical protein UA08_07515 [Talaromyces atroroseus]
MASLRALKHCESNLTTLRDTLKIEDMRKSYHASMESQEKFVGLHKAAFLTLGKLTKANLVENLMRDIMKDLKALAICSTFNLSDQLGQLEDAVTELSKRFVPNSCKPTAAADLVISRYQTGSYKRLTRKPTPSLARRHDESPRLRACADQSNDSAPIPLHGPVEDSQCGPAVEGQGHHRGWSSAVLSVFNKGAFESDYRDTLRGRGDWADCLEIYPSIEPTTLEVEVLFEPKCRSRNIESPRECHIQPAQQSDYTAKMANNHDNALPAPTLYHLSSSQSMRILWALEELSLSRGLEYNVKHHRRERGRAPAVLQETFPLGKSPILEIPGVQLFRPLPFIYNKNDSPDTIITESRLILQLLSDHYSAGEWMPTSDEDQDRNLYFQEFANTTLSPIVDRILYFQIIPPNAPWIVRPLMYAIFNPIVKIFVHDVDAPFALMERALSDEKPWFAGANLGLADFSMSWPLDSASQRGLFDERKYPKVADWLKRVHDRPAYQSAIKKGTPYDLVRFEVK